MSNNYTDSLLQSMSIIAEQAVKNADYDRTVQATIISCVDPTIGKYKVNYQNGSWYAFSSNTNTTYVKGASVYILIPGGDMNNTKTILGTTKQLGINYISTVEDIERYALNGNSITSGDNFELCSYKTNTVTLYPGNSSFSIDIDSANTYLKKSSHLVVSALVKTNLPFEQRYNGNYGLNFYLVFKTATEGDVTEEVTRKYTFDVDNMEGNPYVLPNGLNQKAFFQIDGTNFVKISKIEMFVNDFPNQDNEHPNDIFLSNISLYGADILSQQELDGVALVLNAPKGYIFNKNDTSTATRTINAQVRVQGKAIDNNSQKLAYYWFVQDCTITSKNLFYCKYGGQGWKCLNPYKKVSQTTYSFNAGPATYSIKKDDVKIKQKKYKCVVVYDNTVISKQFTIINNNANYTITIESDMGTEFVKDTGYPTLTCNVTGDNNNLEYIWAQTTNTGTFNFLQDQTTAYDLYQQKLTNYNNLKTGFKNGTKLKNGTYFGSVTNITQYNNLEKELKTLNITQYITKNKIVHLNVKNITNFSIFTCTIKDKDNNVIGSASITIVNKATSTGGYSVIINNGSQVFNYDENGVSPCSRSQSEPFNIPALSFTLYDMNGREVNQDDIKSNDVEWIIPNTNTMLEVSDGTINTDQITKTVKGKILVYSIAQRYSINKTNNDIRLRIKYHDYTISNKTTFTFTKQGQLGTNGTGFVVKIVPCNSNGEDIGIYPVATTTNGTTYTYNFHHLNIQLWHNGDRIFNNNKKGNSTESKSVNIVWSILKNKYASNTYDNTSFTINAESGTLGNNSGMNLATLCSELNKTTPTPTSTTALNNTPANIIKAAVVYDGITYYATLPIITVYKNSAASNTNYSVTLAQNTGFRYAVYSEDGRTPQYDNHEPFTLKVTMPVNGQKEDVSISTVSGYSPIYKYGYLGEYYEGTSRKLKICLMNNGTAPKNPPKNTKYVKPIDSYDGLIVTNAVYSIVTIGNAVMFIHIPVHFMLNRYGHSAINAWDGNSVSIDKDGSGMILSPQIGAGKKEKDESFTGILIGNVKQTNPVKEQTGLFGYESGVRSIFLDANTGNATFGKPGAAQITIDATTNEGSIQSHDYSNSKGMKIKFSSTGQDNDKGPYIKFGSGHFSVDADGNLTAEGGGKIAGWTIGIDALTKGKVGMSSNNSSGTNIAFWAGNATSTSAPFRVNFNGDLVANTATLGSGTKKITLGKNSAGDNSAIYSNGKNSLSSTKTGFYLGTDGIAIGNYNDKLGGSAFEVKADGSLYARQGYIGNGSSGFTITTNAIYNGKTDYGSNQTGVYIGTSGIGLGKGTFWVNKDGKLHATSGDIAGWTISNSALRNSNASDTFYEKNGKVKHESNGIYIGNAGIRMGSNFHITSNGDLWCQSGNIGNWIINGTGIANALKNPTVTLYPTGLTLGKISIDSKGAISNSNGNKGTWSITSEGIATFSNINITGGSMTGGSIGGGKAGNPTISPGACNYGGSGGYKTLDDWCDGIAQLKVDSIDADFITGRFEKVDFSISKAIGCTDLSCTNIKFSGSIEPTGGGVKSGKGLSGSPFGLNFAQGIYIGTVEGTDTNLSNYAKKADLPDLSGYAKTSDIPTLPTLNEYRVQIDGLYHTFYGP